MKNVYLLSRLLLLYAAILAVYVNSRSLNREENRSVPQLPCSKDGSCNSIVHFRKIQPETELRAYKNDFSNSKPWTERKLQARRVRAAFNAEECSSNQDLQSVGATPSNEVLAEFCGGHCDGVYSLGCTQDYVACAGGIPYVMACPENLILDVASEECIEKDQADVCKQASSAVAFGSGFENDFASKNFSCLGLGNSFQSVGCSPICIACVFDEAILYAKCPGLLKYDIASQSCLPAAQLSECVDDEEGLTTVMPEKLETTIEIVTEIAPESPVPEVINEPDVVPEEPASVPEAPVGFGASGSSQSAAQSSQPLPTPVQQVANHRMIAFSCEGKDDGLYGEQCSIEIVACFDGRAVLMRCPEGFLFDTASRICMQQSAMPACGGDYAVAPKVSSTAGTAAEVDMPETTEAAIAFGSGLSDSVTLAPSGISEPTLVPMPENSCDGLQDGIYGSGCSNQSFVCVTGIPILLLVCPTTKFDLSTKSCMPEQQVSSCSAESEPNGEAPILMQSANAAFAGPQPTNEIVAFGEPSDEIPETDARQQQTPEHSKLLIFSCNGLPDGIYGDMCATEFYVCIRGNAALLQCPDDFVYDAEAKYCKSLETMPQCPVSTELAFGATADANEKEFSCEFMPDGMYGQGCSTQFTACVAGSPIGMVCPAELKYDEESVKCLAAADVPACGGQELEPVVSDDEETIPPVESRPPVVQSFPSEERPSCEDKVDGLYGAGCSGEFYACVSGEAIPMRCPGMEKFDESTKQCLGGAQVAACGDRIATEETPAVAFGSSGSSLVTPPNPSSPEFSCAGLPDGAYVEGCSAEVTLCLSSRAVKYQCPDPLKYDADSMMCLPENRVAACQDQSSTMESSSVISSESQLPVPMQASGFTCEGKPDGAYVRGCSAEFIMCTSGLATYYQCPSPNKYDAEAEMCREEEFISACTSRSVTNTVSGGAPVTAPTIDCSKRPDGPVSSGCSSSFQYCVDGELKQYACPGDLKFDNVTRKCLAEPLVGACAEEIAFGSATAGDEMEPSTEQSHPGSVSVLVPLVYLIVKMEQQPTVAPTEETTLAVVEVITEEPAVPEQTTLVEEIEELSPVSGVAGNEPVSCEGKENGAYSDGCASEFYVCINGNIFYLYCRSPLKFDHQSNQCREPANIPFCATDETTETDVVAFGSAVAASPCAGFEDGVYEEGACSSTFLVCIDGQNITIHCPVDYAYKDQFHSCISKAEIPECANQETISQPTVVSTTEEVVAFGSGSEQIAVSCEGRQDGLYAEGCTSEFTACIGGQPIQMRCPGLQVFDIVSKQCLPQKYVEACGATSEAIEAFSQGSPSFEVTSIQEGTQRLNPLGSVRSMTPATPEPKPTVFLFPLIPFVTSCVGLPDGKYSRGICSAEFVLCIGGQAKLNRCPSSLLKFDSSSQHCLPAGFVKECGGEETDDSAPILRPNQTVAFGAAPETETSDFTCEGQPDGQYAQGCSPEFIQCEGGVAKLLRCPGSLIFDGATQRCRPASYVGACTGSPIPVGEAIQTTTAAEGPQIIDKPLLTMATCFGKPDGTFADGCTSVFFMCLAGRETFYECPNNLKFDAVTEKCAPESVVPACGGPVPEGPSFGREKILGRRKGKSVVHEEGAALHQSVGGSSVLKTPAKKPSAGIQSRGSFGCTKLPDGIYTQGCSAEFTLCVAGMPLLYHCPGRLMFDAGSEKCLTQGLVDSCAEATTETVTEQVVTEIVPEVVTEEVVVPEVVTEAALIPEAITETPVVDITEAPTEMITEQSPVAFGASSGVSEPSIPVAYSITSLANLDPTLYFCLGKPNGLYVDGCTSDFFICVAQTTLALHCTNSLKYDQVFGLCMDESEVEACIGNSGGVAVVVPRNIVPETNIPATETLQGFGSGVANTDLTAYCNGRLDGLYADGCSSQFVSCLRGHGTSYDCPENMKFDIESSICAPQDEVAACRGKSAAIVQKAGTASDFLGRVGTALNFNL